MIDLSRIAGLGAIGVTGEKFLKIPHPYFIDSFVPLLSAGKVDGDAAMSFRSDDMLFEVFLSQGRVQGVNLFAKVTGKLIAPTLGMVAAEAPAADSLILFKTAVKFL